MGGITSKQWFQIISGVNGGLITGAALLQTLFGQDLTLKIVAVLGIVGIIINSVGAALSGQGNMIRDVAAMPGVARVSIDATASPTVAAVALDPTQKNVGATTPGVRDTLIKTAAS